ncbi:hypothetical protein HDU76_011474 [Blyttiomyces sp. JEL0837]|nr:hypothetical protein HDU76_011474 [Blyttiomyces sp. JEL0837]
MRSVSKTWRDYTDRVFFRKIVLTGTNIDAFIDWISTTATDISETKKQTKRKSQPAVQESLATPECRDVLRFINYVEILMEGVERKVQYRIKIKEALKGLPKLKGAIYERREVLRLTTGFYANDSLLNLRVLSLNFMYSDEFEFELLKHLVKVDTMAINALTDPSFSLVDKLCILPKSLRLLKLDTAHRLMP